MSEPIKTFEYNERDFLSVNHFIVFGRKKDAFVFGKKTRGSANEASLSRMANDYFKQDSIQFLLNTELQNIRKKAGVLLERLGVKNPIPTNGVGIEGIDLNNIQDIDKKKAIAMITHTLNHSNGKDAVQAKLFPILAKLNEWDKEQINHNNNITIYELPRYQ